MALIPREVSKSFRIVSTNEDGNEIFAANAMYNSRSINMNFEMLDTEYCASHPDEIEESISNFLVDFNAALSEDNHPIIIAPDKSN